MVVNEYDERDLALLFLRFGEEPLGKRIARRIVNLRAGGLRISTTGEFAALVRDVCPRPDLAIKTLSRVFQALRIEVNDELGVLEKTLEDGFSILSSGGRMAVISYHSLEDRIVKRCFVGLATADWGPKGLAIREPLRKASGLQVTRKPVLASDEEISRNPRARSAKLRVIEKL
jgi:16S rRNA (cytosine1402-N4)-methyltransferase